MSNITPTEGMGATEHIGSDRYPYTVIIIVSPKKIVVRSDNFKRIDNNGAFTEQQSYEYEPDPKGTEKTLTLRKNGRWIPEGESMNCGYSFSIGQRSAYRDPCF